MLKGEVKPIAELVPMTPVEILDKDLFKRYDHPEAPRLGIVTHVETYWHDREKMYVNVEGLFGDKFKIIESYVPKTAAPLKILTGTTRDKLLKQRYGDTDANIEAALKGIYMGGSGYLGSDPEIFVVDGEGTLIPADSFLPDKKAKPNFKDSNGYHGNIFWDGFQAEFTTYPAACLAWQMDSVQAGLENLLQFARKHSPKAKLSIQNVFEIPQQVRETAPEHLVQLGCAPSKNIYGLEPVKALGDGRKLPFRCAGGHMHFGCGKLTPKQEEEVVKSLDALLGVALVSLFEPLDNPVRRSQYGRAGEYRAPVHGIEYRVPSNAWLTHPGIANLVFNLGRMVVKFANAGLRVGLHSYTEQKVQDIINSCDAPAARKFMEANKGAYYAMFNAEYNGHYTYGLPAVKAAYDTLIRPVDATVKDPTDIEGNWELGKKTWRSHCEGEKRQWRTFSQYVARGEKA